RASTSMGGLLTPLGVRQRALLGDVNASWDGRAGACVPPERACPLKQLPCRGASTGRQQRLTSRGAPGAPQVPTSVPQRENQFRRARPTPSVQAARGARGFPFPTSLWNDPLAARALQQLEPLRDGPPLRPRSEPACLKRSVR